MINSQLCFDWPSYWLLNDHAFLILNDIDWAKLQQWNSKFVDPELEAAEAEYGGAMLLHSNDCVSVGKGEILLVFDSEGIEGQVSADHESIASDTQSREIENEWTRDTIAKPIAENQKQTLIWLFLIH